jgi:hypothetical protein
VVETVGNGGEGAMLTSAVSSDCGGVRLTVETGSIATAIECVALVPVAVIAGCVLPVAFLQHGWLLMSPQSPPIALQQACSSGVTDSLGSTQRNAGAAVHMKRRRTTNVERAFAITQIITKPTD